MSMYYIYNVYVYIHIYIYIICVCVCACVCVRVVLYGLYCTGVSFKKYGLPQNVDNLSFNQLIIIWSILVVQLFRDVGRPDRCTPSQEC